MLLNAFSQIYFDKIKETHRGELKVYFEVDGRKKWCGADSGASNGILCTQEFIRNYIRKLFKAPLICQVGMEVR